MTPEYKRVLLKLSGEALMGRDPFGISPDIIDYVVQEIGAVFKLGVQIGIVVGGGNIFRGVAASANGMDRVAADNIGMLATVINSLALQDALENQGIPARTQTAVAIQKIAEPYVPNKAVEHLKQGRIVILAAGTGNPYFTTDTAAVLRAKELNAQLLLKATQVDGVYDSDPAENPEAKFIKKLSYMQALEKRLKVMDATAISLAMDNDLPMIVFKLMAKGNFLNIICGEQTGSLVSS